MTDFLQIASREAQQGRLVFPCKGKIPITPNGCLDATTDTATIEAWAEQYPDANVGIAFRNDSREVGMDVDCYDPDIAEWLDEIQQVHGLIETRTVITGNGGYHYYFIRPQGVTMPNVSKLSKLGFELKSINTYLLAPGSIHPDTGKEYELARDIDPQPMPDWLIKLALQPVQGHCKKILEPNWITNLMKGVPEGSRNQSCASLAGYYAKSLPEDITTSILCAWDKNNIPPMGEGRVRDCVKSVYHTVLSKGNSIYTTNIYRGVSESVDSTPKNEISLKSGQVGGQVLDIDRTSLKVYGELSTAFDSYLKDNPEPHNKREVAEIIGTTYRDPSFIKLVQRRAKDNDIRITHGGDKIQWINKEWQRSIVSLEQAKSAFLDLRLPFGLDRQVLIPQHSQIVVAGDVGSGKTHYGYEFANINVGKMEIRHFVNEIGGAKAVKNLEDFPELFNHYGKDYDIVDLDKEGLDVTENLDPAGINIYDYLHLPNNKEWFLQLQSELANLSRRLTTGLIVVFLQKKRGEPLAMGRDSTRMQCQLYLGLNIVDDVKGDETHHGYKEVRIDVVKCKDWATYVNPETLSFVYRTGPRWGKLIPYSNLWSVMERNVK